MKKGIYSKDDGDETIWIAVKPPLKGGILGDATENDVLVMETFCVRYGKPKRFQFDGYGNLWFETTNGETNMGTLLAVSRNPEKDQHFVSACKGKTVTMIPVNHGSQ